MLIPIILSGGSGTRLWPLSNGNHPKQFLSLISDKTMIQETLLRLDGLKIDAPMVICNKNHRFIVAEQISAVSKKKPVVMLEPVAKNTAPAIACGCFSAMQRDKDAVVIILPSDHVIADIGKFQKAVKVAAKEALENKSLVTFGIVPSEPNTGYGYIKTTGSSKDNVFVLESFKEKPDLETAKSYLADGNYSWNSGMFVFKAESFLEELKSFEPQMYELSKAAFENASVDDDFIRLNLADFEQIKGNSIDYAVMERTKRGKVVKLDAGWNDVGSWSALWDIQKKDKDGNVITGDVISLKTTDSYIRAGKRKIATIGLDNVVIVDSEDAILIAAKDKVQDVKTVAEKVNKL